MKSALDPGPQAAKAASNVALQCAESALQLTHKLVDPRHACLSAPLSLGIRLILKSSEVADEVILALLKCGKDRALKVVKTPQDVCADILESELSYCSDEPVRIGLLDKEI